MVQELRALLGVLRADPNGSPLRHEGADFVPAPGLANYVSARRERRVTIRVVVADDQALVRGSFRLLADTALGLTALGEAATGTAIRAVSAEEESLPGAVIQGPFEIS